MTELSLLLRRAICFLAVVAVLAACTGQTASQQPVAPVSSTAADSTAGELPTELGPTPPDQRVQFTVSLRLPGAAELDRYLRGLVTPGSSAYQHYLQPAEFGSRFGLSDARVAAVVEWVEKGGLQVDVMPQRTSLAVAGTAAQVRAVLGVDLVDWQNAAGQRYHVPTGEAAVPENLGNDVAAVLGLNTEPLIRPASVPPVLKAGAGAGLLPDTVAKAYEISPLHDAGLDGQGMTIAIVSFDTFTPSDVDLFDRNFNIAGAPPVDVVHLDGGPEEPGDGSGEVALDIQVIRGIAPQAQIVNYEGPNTADGFVPIVSRIVADGRAKIVSISWGLCENQSSVQAMRAEQREFAAAFAAGISVFSSSGDDAAYDCRRVNVSDNPFERDLSPGVDWPSASPNVISVGGTFLSIRQDGTYLEEAGWEEPLGGAGGGGGLSAFHQRPDWQVGAGVDNSASNGMRQVPDVAGPADPTSGFVVTYTDPGRGLVSGRVGGTSAAAPFWAASMLLTQELAAREGVAFLGPLGPVLYQVAAEQPTGAVFHDVIRGGNLLYSAGPGWDFSTGLGTPRVAPLARAIIDLLKR
ncbi:MAG TPA: S53 family peptidase [Candidatus Limnocylindrales bacterium]|nr:S53 family peptidase [Candidatus Limnocylindrales bacterium]